jgi:signal transduction histidine kinase
MILRARAPVQRRTTRLLEAQMVRAQRLERLGTLAGGIAHDFNNILTAIIGNLDFARKTTPSGHPAQEALAEAERASTLAAELVRRILTFSGGAIVVESTPGRGTTFSVYFPADDARPVEQSGLDGPQTEARD